MNKRTTTIYEITDQDLLKTEVQFRFISDRQDFHYFKSEDQQRAYLPGGMFHRFDMHWAEIYIGDERIGNFCIEHSRTSGFDSEWWSPQYWEEGITQDQKDWFEKFARAKYQQSIERDQAREWWSKIREGLELDKPMNERSYREGFVLDSILVKTSDYNECKLPYTNIADMNKLQERAIAIGTWESLRELYEELTGIKHMAWEDAKTSHMIVRHFMIGGECPLVQNGDLIPCPKLLKELQEKKERPQKKQPLKK